MALNANIPLATETANPLGAIFESQGIQSRKLSNQASEQAIDKQAQEMEKRSLIDGATQLNEYLKVDDIDGAKRFTENRIKSIQARNGNAQQSMEVLERLNAGDVQGIKNDVNSILALDRAVTENPAAVQEFVKKAQMAGLQPGTKEFQNALLIDLGVNPRAGTTTEKERLAGDPELTKDVADSQAEIEGAKSKAKEQAKVDVEVESAENVGEARGRIAKIVEGAKLEARDLSNLKATQDQRNQNMEKAQYFLNAFEKGDRKSGSGRAALNYAPIGTWTDQGEFDELFNAFAEVAARAQLKASGEIRPTDADVQGMKNAIFGIGRDEQVNIQLLKDYINLENSLSQRVANSNKENASGSGSFQTQSGITFEVED